MVYAPDAYTLYEQDLAGYLLDTDATSDASVENAQNGDKTARDALLSCCLENVVWLACQYRGYVPHDDVCDLIGIGNLALVEALDSALEKEHPLVYLIDQARKSLYTYVTTRSSLIVTPAQQRRIAVESLDEIISASTTKTH